MTVRIYKIESSGFSEVKKVLERPEITTVEGKEEFKKNEFARNGYTLRDGKSLGLDEANYLYIKAEDEFFKEHEKEIMLEGVKLLDGEESEKVKNLIDAEQNSAEAGVGAVFGDL